MSIKSEKEIRELAIDFSSHPNSPVAQRASFIVADVMLPYLIRKVEQRCRERVVRAFCQSCDLYGGKNYCPAMLECECDYVENFLKYYDK